EAVGAGGIGARGGPGAVQAPSSGPERVNMFVAANIFQPLIAVFEAVLKFLHNHVGLSWGLAIVALTILMRAVLLPLTVKQFHSMQKLQLMQPQMKAIQAKYKDDKQRQQQELMKFYKENQINPLSS